MNRFFFSRIILDVVLLLGVGASFTQATSTVVNSIVNTSFEENGSDTGMLWLACEESTCDDASGEEGVTLGQVAENLRLKLPTAVRDSYIPLDANTTLGEWTGWFGSLSITDTFQLFRLWSRGVFEVDGIPEQLQPFLVVIRQPYFYQYLYKWLYDTVAASKIWVASYLPPPDDKPLSVYPCDPSRPFLSHFAYDESSLCECIGQKCLVATSPTRNPCLFLDVAGLSDGSWEVKYKVQLRTDRGLYQISNLVPHSLRQWIPNVFPTYPVRLLVSWALLCLAKPVSEFRPLHYLVGGFFGAAVAGIIVLYTLYKQTRAIVPGGRYITDMGGVGLMATTAFGLLAAQDWLLSLLVKLGELLRTFFDYGAFGNRHLGKIFFGTAICCGMLCTKYFRWFANEPKSGHLNWTNGQANLARLLSLVALWCSFHCTCDFEASLMVTFLMLWWEALQYYRWRIHIWLNRSKPTYKYINNGKPMSKEEFEAQGQLHTQREMEKLRKYYEENPSSKYKGQNAGRIEAFLHGRPHVEIEDDQWKKSSWCAIL